MAISFSSLEGILDPSEAAKVPAPQGEPIESQAAISTRPNRHSHLHTSMRLFQRNQLREPGGIPQGYKYHALMHEGRHERERRHLLPTARRRRRHEHPRVLAREIAMRPELPSRVPERLWCRGAFSAGKWPK